MPYTSDTLRHVIGRPLQQAERQVTSQEEKTTTTYEPGEPRADDLTRNNAAARDKSKEDMETEKRSSELPETQPTPVAMGLDPGSNS